MRFLEVLVRMYYKRLGSATKNIQYGNSNRQPTGYWLVM
jgi:hypothetical protein